MTPEEEKQFERIAQDAMSQAEQVNCDMQTFYDGLKLIGEQIRDRREIGADEGCDVG
ncbi:MAG: hypothetical protein ACYSW8_32765 [Planctomycetota bacterium]|jgi:hypothetical protein